MLVKPWDPPEGFSSASVVTVTLADLQLYAQRVASAAVAEDPVSRIPVRIGPCPWLGDGGEDHG